MTTLPRECKHCGEKLMHYGACSCPEATLDWIGAERETIRKRLERLKQIEKEALATRLQQLGPLGSRSPSPDILLEMSQKMTDEMMAALSGANAFKSPRPTALRLTPSGGFEVVEIHDDGSIIEPPKPCRKCGPFLLCAEHMALVT